MKERAIITPGLIRQVQLMLAGGATGKEVAEITGTSEGTISRIKKAGFDYDTFLKNTEARRKPARENLWPVEFIRQEMEKQEPEKLELQGGVDYQVKVNEELEGQIGMELEPEKPAEMSDKVKLMRFIAGQFDGMEKMLKAEIENQNKNIEAVAQWIAVVCNKIEKTNDYLGQILRVIGPESGKRG